MLHGDIKVNGNVIGEWQAVRTSPDLRDDNEYDCRMTYRNLAGYPMEAAWRITDHHYKAGAAALAARVIAEGMERLRVKPMDSDRHAVDMVSRYLNGQA